MKIDAEVTENRSIQTPPKYSVGKIDEAAWKEKYNDKKERKGNANIENTEKDKYKENWARKEKDKW